MFKEFNNAENDQCAPNISDIKTNDYLSLINSNSYFYHLFKFQSQKNFHLIKKRKNKIKKLSKSIQVDLLKERKSKNTESKELPIVRKKREKKTKIEENTRTIEEMLLQSK